MSRFDTDLFDPPPDPELVCSICHSVFDNPVECPCRHVFCRVCIETWLGNRRNCPTCRDRVRKRDLKQVMPMIQNMISNLQLKCINHQSGCDEKITVEAYDRHTGACMFTPVTCSFSQCGRSLVRRDLEQHERCCDCRQVKCQAKCGMMIAYRDLGGHDCLASLIEKVREQECELERLKQRENEMEQMKADLEDQLDSAQRQFQIALQHAHRELLQPIGTDVDYYPQDEDDNASVGSNYTEYTLADEDTLPLLLDSDDDDDEDEESADRSRRTQSLANRHAEDFNNYADGFEEDYLRVVQLMTQNSHASLPTVSLAPAEASPSVVNTVQAAPPGFVFPSQADQLDHHGSSVVASVAYPVCSSSCPSVTPGPVTAAPAPLSVPASHPPVPLNDTPLNSLISVLRESIRQEAFMGQTDQEPTGRDSTTSSDFIEGEKAHTVSSTPSSGGDAPRTDADEEDQEYVLSDPEVISSSDSISDESLEVANDDFPFYSCQRSPCFDSDRTYHIDEASDSEQISTPKSMRSSQEQLTDTEDSVRSSQPAPDDTCSPQSVSSPQDHQRSFYVSNSEHSSVEIVDVIANMVEQENTESDNPASDGEYESEDHTELSSPVPSCERSTSERSTSLSRDEHSRNFGRDYGDFENPEASSAYTDCDNGLDTSTIVTSPQSPCHGSDSSFVSDERELSSVCEVSERGRWAVQQGTDASYVAADSRQARYEQDTPSYTSATSRSCGYSPVDPDSSLQHADCDPGRSDESGSHSPVYISSDAQRCFERGGEQDFLESSSPCISHSASHDYRSQDHSCDTSPDSHHGDRSPTVHSSIASCTEDLGSTDGHSGFEASDNTLVGRKLEQSGEASDYTQADDSHSCYQSYLDTSPSDVSGHRCAATSELTDSSPTQTDVSVPSAQEVTTRHCQTPVYCCQPGSDTSPAASPSSSSSQSPGRQEKQATDVAGELHIVGQVVERYVEVESDTQEQWTRCGTVQDCDQRRHTAAVDRSRDAAKNPEQHRRQSPSLSLRGNEFPESSLGCVPAGRHSSSDLRSGIVGQISVPSPRLSHNVGEKTMSASEEIELLEELCYLQQDRDKSYGSSSAPSHERRTVKRKLPETEACESSKKSRHESSTRGSAPMLPWHARSEGGLEQYGSAVQQRRQRHRPTRWSVHQRGSGPGTCTDQLNTAATNIQLNNVLVNKGAQQEHLNVSIDLAVCLHQNSPAPPPPPPPTATTPGPDAICNASRLPYRSTAMLHRSRHRAGTAVPQAGDRTDLHAPSQTSSFVDATSSIYTDSVVYHDKGQMLTHAKQANGRDAGQPLPNVHAAAQVLDSVDLSSQDDSDVSWEPPPDGAPSDESISSGGEETDTSYEVFVPKSAAQLLHEYDSTESDDSWQP